MSAEISPLLGNTSNTTSSTEPLDTDAIVQLEKTLTAKNNEQTPLIDQDEPPILPAIDEVITNTPDHSEISSGTDKKLPNTEEQLAEIAELQEKLLNNEDFNLSELESPGAGVQDNPVVIGSEKSTSSPLYIETNIINVTSENTPTSVSRSTQANSETIIAFDSSENELSGDTNHNVKIDAQVNEDLVTSRSGNFGNKSLDAGSISSEYGTLNYQADGSWTYTLDNQSDKVQALGANENISDPFTITTKSGDTIELTININGTNDTPIINGDTSAEVNTLSNFEPGNRPESVTGKLDISDKDSGQAHFVANDEINGTYGKASVNESGEWSYALDSQLESVKNLKDGDSLTDTITVLSKDGTNQHINITIFGADDSPILGGKNSESININEQTQISEKLTINDPDFGESSFIAKSDIESENGYGIGAIDSNGNWNFTVKADHPAVSSLEDKEQLLDFFMVTTADGTKQSIIIKIQNGVINSDLNEQSLSSNENSIQISIIEELDDQSILDELNSEKHAEQSPSSNSDTAISISSSNHLDSSLIDSHILGQNTNNLDSI